VKTGITSFRGRSRSRVPSKLGWSRSSIKTVAAILVTGTTRAAVDRAVAHHQTLDRPDGSRA
jgi:hypothetical protein